MNARRAVSFGEILDGAPADSDGRRRRSQDSRARIVTAMLELTRAGEITPGAEQVAARAKVGPRTVFRHFKDMDSLYREIFRVIEDELLDGLARPFKAATWQSRVLELIERRSRAYDRIAPFRRAADVHRHNSPFLDERRDRLAARSREILVRQLPAKLAGDALWLETLDLLLSYEAWNRLRRDQGLTARRAREVLAAAVKQVLELS